MLFLGTVGRFVKSYSGDRKSRRIMQAGIDRIALVTDFGEGPYVGQMRARLAALASAVPQIDLVHDLPPFRPDLAAYLLPALARDMPRGTLYLCVVDPGVGGDRAALVVQAGDDWLIGPDNGLLAPMAAHADQMRVWRLGWQPQAMSASFHGRDWFAPAAARLCNGQELGLEEIGRADMIGADWPSELQHVLYVDRYGNAMTGLRVPPGSDGYRLPVGSHLIERARTFCEAPVGHPFWYENAFGLVEIAVNQGRADTLLKLSPGERVGPLAPGEA